MISRKHLKTKALTCLIPFYVHSYSYDGGADDAADGAILSVLHRNNIYRRLREKDTSLTEIK